MVLAAHVESHVRARESSGTRTTGKLGMSAAPDRRHESGAPRPPPIALRTAARDPAGLTAMTPADFAVLLRANPEVTAVDQDTGLPVTAIPIATVRDRQTVPTEHDEQAALFRWAASNEPRCPALRWLFAVPNGGHRRKAVAAQLAAEGVKAGVPDVMLPVPRGGWHGLFIELKRADGRNRPTAQQRAWLDGLVDQGYRTAVAYGATEAIALVTAYLGMEGEDG